MKIEHMTFDNEGGHMSASTGRIVQTPDCDLAYKVVLTHHDCNESEHVFGTMREGEAFIRRNTPLPAARCTLFDRAACDV